MKEISNALSDVIFTICNKIVSKAKFDKTYKCRVVNQISDNKCLVMKDNVEHIVASRNTYYEENQVVYVLLPENNWRNALIL